MPSNIPAPRVPMIDPKSGLVNRQWYAFLLNLFNLADAGRNDITLTDLQQLPPVIPYTPYTPPVVTGKFYAYKNTGQTLSAGFEDQLLFQAKVYDEAGEFNTSTSVFTAASAGEWIISAAATISGQTSGNTTRIVLYRNGSVYCRLSGDVVGGAASNTLSNAVPITLATGDTLQVKIYSSGSSQAVAGQDITYFTGLKVR